MPPPTNISAATATDLGLFPFTFTQDVSGASGPSYEVWYKFTPPSGTPDAVGMLALGTATSTYHPKLTVWVGPLGSLGTLLDFIDVDRTPMQIPVTASTTYYLQIIQGNSGVVPDVILTLSGVLPSNLLVPAGSIAVNDDSTGFPVALMSPTDGSITRFVGGFSAGEAGDILPDGTVLVEDIDNPPPNGGIVLWDRSLRKIAQIGQTPPTGHTKPIRASLSGSFFYVAFLGIGMNPANVIRVNPDGTIGPTTWNIGGTGILGIGASPDDTILYSVTNSANAPVKRWDLVNNVALSDLVAGTAGVAAGGNRDAIVVLPDGSIVVAYHTIATGANVVKRFSAAGTLLNTYSFGTDLIDRLATSPTAGNFWVWTQPDSITDVFTEIKASDGSTVRAVTGPEFEDGIYVGAIAATPPRFGHSNSCPFWITRQPLGPPIPPFTTTTYPVRRLRRSPHLSNQQLWQTIHQFQLDIEAGVGLVDGIDPQLMLRWSDDGGHTWSNEHWVGAGKIGEYKRRAIWRLLGRSRDRVWEVVVDAPVRWRFLQAFVDATLGTS